jgi:hypothetical protein
MKASAPTFEQTLKVKAPFRVLCLCSVVVLAAFWLRFYQLPSVPFGWHLDEAAHGLEARDLLHGAPWPIFFSQFTGHEALYIYLEAASMAVFGETIWAGRLVSAFAGVLTVALTLPLGKVLWPGRRGRHIGQWAALLLAVSLWHLIESRNGYRAILQPLVQLPAVILLLKALRPAGARPARRWLWWALAGLFTGLSIHTYLAARAFPGVIALVAGAAILAGPDRFRKLQGLGLALLVAFLITLPLIVHFINRPIDWYGRSVQVSIWTSPLASGGPWKALESNLLAAAGMFMQRGDPSFKYNIAQRPVFDPVLGTLFWIGIAWTVVGLAGRKTAFVSVTLLGWLSIMLLPMVLSAQDIPHYLRSIGALPVVMIFPALALEWVWTWCSRFLSPRLRLAPATLDLALIVPFIGLTAAGHQQYFRDWNNVVANDQERVVQMVYLYNDLKSSWQGEPLYISTAYPEHTTLAFLSAEMYAAMHGFDGRQSVPLPPEGAAARYYALLDSPPNPFLMQKANLRLTGTAQGRFGQDVYQVYAWSGRRPSPQYTQPMGWSWDTQFGPGWQPAPLSAPVNFGQAASLEGYDLTATTAAPGHTIDLTLYWQLPGPAPEEYSMFAHVLDAQSQVVTQSDGNTYPAMRWHAGELLLSDFPLRIPEGTPPGTYQLEVGIYKLFSGERLQVFSSGSPVADRLLLQPIVVR